MAVNWKLAEAVKAIRANDVEAIKDIAKRFPLFAVNAAGGVEGLLRILEAAPEYLTARKIETVLRGGADADTDEDEDSKEEKDEKPAKAKKSAKDEAEGEDEGEEKPVKALSKKELMKKKPKELKNIAEELELDILESKKFKKLEGDEKKEALVNAIAKAQKTKEKDEDKPDKKKDEDEDDWDV